MLQLHQILAEIQKNPRDLQSYRKLVDYYYKSNLINEAEAFQKLIEIKYGLNSTDNNEKSTRPIEKDINVDS